MKKILAFLLCAVLLTALLSAEEKYDARKLKWGMSAQEVKAIENIQDSYVSVSGSLVLYKKAKLFDNDIIIKFCFDADSQLRMVEYESLKINSDYNEKFLEAIKKRYGKKEGDADKSEEGEVSRQDEEMAEEDNTTLNYLKLLRNKRYLYKYPEEALKYVKKGHQVELKASDDYDLIKNLIKAKIWQYNNTVLLYNSIQGNSSILVVQYIDKDFWEKAKQELENLLDAELKKIAARKEEPAEESEEIL
ncbi:MAG: hypothetical protein GTO45_25310 [Candidatus Aminicenantes bacterium]|nr:hypothetical protein [Candidatus Aminicenantes bacterium]NIM82062.1 hypothetical protein [Candidatus Aminicenantes bacterium]NIN21460.1 hypothetical protein [Candidatus Aminicenantes bacterium]NIN45272.1 hypothetical protein [Candidatus Aminicenantes bacterium]NIN88089.1 hypothetical protein [Candidatus Aminicenantes bacterium]